jgi:ubiquitin-conjugating enzyme E2 S
MFVFSYLYLHHLKLTREFVGWFQTKIFHPNVSSAGEICVNTLKKDWKSSYGIAHILVTVKCLLIYPNPESALDEEAGKLLLENYEDYCARAKLITSVHATPKVKPAEFEGGEAEAPASTPTPKLAIPQRKTVSSLPVPAKTTPALKKELGVRHVSPAPLGTADANVGGGPGKSVNEMGSATADGTTTIDAPAKAVKRAATGGAGSGAEKRKKALKRL